MIQAVILVLKNLDFQSNLPNLNSLVSKGVTGRLVWTKSGSLESALNLHIQGQVLSNYSVDIPHTSVVAEEVLGLIQNSNLSLVLLDCSQPGTTEVAEWICALENVHLSVVVSHCNFPEFPKVPKQSFNFMECKDISSEVFTEHCAAYVEYENNYTRVDWVQNLGEMLSEVGANRVILAHNHTKEVCFRLGISKKYGA